MKSVLGNKFVAFGSVSTPNDFVVASVIENIRLDGRSRMQFRDPEVTLSRCEENSVAELTLGNTKVIATSRGDLVTPYADRSGEGSLIFSCVVSSATKAADCSENEIISHLEKHLKMSDAIDLESLCIISGKRVWQIGCEIVILENGGNVKDAALFAAVAALRAFRRPDVSQPGDESESLVKMRFDDSEPLPLAFHHTPLTVSIAVFNSTNDNGTEPYLVVDPLVEEDVSSNGEIVFCVNANREIHGFQKQGGGAISVASTMSAAQLALNTARVLHQKLTAALAELEQRIFNDRAQQVTTRRQKFELNRQSSNTSATTESTTVDITDPTLSFQLLHSPVVLPTTT